MRKILLALSVLVVFMIAVSTATAQNEVALGGSAVDSLTFTGNGSSGWTLTFTPNPLTGSATGSGEMSPINGSYSITDSGVTITGTETSTDVWNVSQTGALGFSIGSLLTGTLQLLNLSQSGMTGTFNYNLAANLTVTGGTDAGLVGNQANLGISIDFDSATDLATIGTGTLLGRISTGELDQTPEPMSMVLVGSGLILLGGLVRRRRKA